LLKSKDLKKEKKVSAMQSLYVRLGVKDDAGRAIEDLHNEAWGNLEKVKFSKRQLDQLSDFANSLLNRER
jgi:geranylgeranyl pyrophosphate synthase